MKKRSKLSRRHESNISGEFRSTLNFWHQARLFGSAPALNGDFITSNPTKRTNAVTSSHALYIMAQHNIRVRRIVPFKADSYIL